jgi:hypothetical protein
VDVIVLFCVIQPLGHEHNWNPNPILALC